MCVCMCVCVCVCVCLCVRVRERGRAGARVSLCACALVHVRVYVCFLSHRRVVCADPNACSFTRWQLYTLSSEHRLSKNGLIFVPAWSKCQHRTKINSIFCKSNVGEPVAVGASGAAWALKLRHAALAL